jgi:hypothetical protein
MSTTQRRLPGGRTFARFFLGSVWLFLVVSAVGPCGVRADDGPVMRAKEKILVNAVGDAHFSVDVKLPIAAYTLLKDQTRNTVLLLRQLGLSHEDAFQIEDVKGEFDDGNSTLHFSWMTRGLARQVRDHVWEAPIDETAGLELMYMNDNVALFSTASDSPLGVVPLVVHAEVARGSTDLQLLHSPNRLAYRTPGTTAPPGGRTSFDFEFFTKPQVMTCLAKSYGNPKFSKLWVARTLLKNTGDQHLTDYRVRYRLREYAPSWSAWKNCADVVPGQTVTDMYFPIFDLEKVGKLSGSSRDTLEMEYQYRRADGQLIEGNDSRTIQLLGRNEVIFSSRKAADCGGWYDHFDYGPSILASFVTKDDPIIQQVAGWVSGQAGGVAANTSDDNAILFMQALYQFMVANGIAYQTPPGGEFNGQFGQHIKYGRDVLQNRAGTCVDLAVFYGSVCEAVGLQPVLFLVPGHCFPAIRLPRSGKIFAVESTGIQRVNFQKVREIGAKEVEECRRKGLLYEVDIVNQHNKGVYGLQLPPLPPSTLTDWGIHPVTATPPQAPTQEAPAATTNPATIPSWLVGVWKCDSNLNRGCIQMNAVFTAEGTYHMSLRYTNESGEFTPWVEERGSLQVGTAELIFTASTGQKKGVAVARKYVTEKGLLWITFQEIRYQFPFTKADGNARVERVEIPSAPPATVTPTWAPPPYYERSEPSGRRGNGSNYQRRGNRRG